MQGTHPGRGRGYPTLGHLQRTQPLNREEPCRTVLLEHRLRPEEVANVEAALAAGIVSRVVEAQIAPDIPVLGNGIRAFPFKVVVGAYAGVLRIVGIVPCVLNAWIKRVVRCRALIERLQAKAAN